MEMVSKMSKIVLASIEYDHIFRKNTAHILHVIRWYYMDMEIMHIIVFYGIMTKCTNYIFNIQVHIEKSTCKQAINGGNES